MANKRDDDDHDDLGYGAGGSGSGSSSGGSGGQGPGVGDTLKKLFTAGISAAFMTEESVRSFVTELKLPKETIHLVLQGAQKSKDQLMDRVGREVVGIISRIDFVKEASRFVEEHKFRITAEIEVTKRESVRPTEPGGHRAAGEESSSSGSQLEVSFKPKTKA